MMGAKSLDRMSERRTASSRLCVTKNLSSFNTQHSLSNTNAPHTTAQILNFPFGIFSSTSTLWIDEEPYSNVTVKERGITKCPTNLHSVLRYYYVLCLCLCLTFIFSALRYYYILFHLHFLDIYNII